MKLKFYSIPAAIIAVCLIFAAVVRFSYTDAGDKIYDYDFVSGGDLAALFKDNQISSPSDLVKQADIIVKAKCTGERKVTASAFYTTVKVSKVYVGDRTINGTNLCIIEPMAVFADRKFINASKPFLIPLQPGQEYLLLLKHMQFDPQRKLNNFQESQYYPVTESAFGYYRISNKNQKEPMNENKTYTINSLKDFDIFTSIQKDLDTYNEYKAQIFSRFGV